MFAELILVLIYIFPGALVDVFDRTFLSKSYKEDPSSNFEKASRYFGYSVIISTFALFIFGAVNGDGVYNLSEIANSLDGTFKIAGFAMMSLLSTILFVFAKRWLNLLWLWLRNRVYKHQGRSERTDSKNAWIELIECDAIKKIETNTILRITPSDKQSIAGFVFLLPREYDDGIVLTRTEEVSKQLNAESKKTAPVIIGEPLAMHFDTKTGSLIEFFDGTNFGNQLP